MKKDSYLQNNKTSISKYILIIVLIIFIFLLGWNVGSSQVALKYNGNKIEQSISKNNNSNVDMNLFWDVWEILASKYVNPSSLDYKQMIYGAIQGMVFSLKDPYTSFLTPKENKEFQDNMEGVLEGIGAELTFKNDLVTVVSPLKNSPAKKAGLQPEDVILEVDGESVDELSFEQVIKKIRGPKGTKVTLTIARKKYNEPIKLDIYRDSINISSVEWRMKDKIAIIELNQFGDNTIDEFNQIINKILKENPNGIILDLRYNGGGYLDGAISIASEFIEKGKVVSVKKRNPKDDEVIYVNGKARLSKAKLVVLINKGSASASEIVAGAIQDNKRGIVVGETSFGKGTVQEIQNLVDGSSLRVTVAKWYTPNNKNISEIGIEPDVKIERTVEDMENEKDPQLEYAIEYLNKK